MRIPVSFGIYDDTRDWRAVDGLLLLTTKE